MSKTLFVLPAFTTLFFFPLNGAQLGEISKKMQGKRRRMDMGISSLKREEQTGSIFASRKACFIICIRVEMLLRQ